MSLARERFRSNQPVPARAGTGFVVRIASARVRLALAATGTLFTVVLLSSVSPQAAPLQVPGRAVAGYADGAPPGFSGGFKEESCDACHFEAKPNTPPGQVTLTGVPERYAPGQRYPLTITLTRPGLALAGFQLAARLESGTQAGSFEKGAGEDTRLAVETQSNVQYVNQRRPGAEPTGADVATWTVVWTAPATATSAVTFHVAANAADKDESARGDYVFTATATSRP